MNDMSVSRRVSKGAWALLRYFDALRKFGWIGPRVEFLCGKFRRSRATILRWIAELKSCGWICVKQRGPRSACYSILRPLSETPSQAHLFTEPSEESPSEKQADALPKKPPAKTTTPVPSAIVEHPEVQCALREALPRIKAARSPEAYARRVVADTWGAIQARMTRQGFVFAEAS